MLKLGEEAEVMLQETAKQQAEAIKDRELVQVQAEKQAGLAMGS